jgi:AraC-like DNA-binding protein
MISCIDVYTQNHKSSDQIKENDTISSAEKKARLYYQLADNSYLEKKFDMYEKYIDSTLHIAQKFGFTYIEIVTLNSKGIYLKNKGEYEEALVIYHKIFGKIKLRPDDTKTKIAVLVNIGNLYHDIKSYDKSIVTMNNVLQLVKLHEGVESAEHAAYISLSENYAKLEDEDNELQYLIKALNLSKVTDNLALQFFSLNNVCDFYKRKKEYVKVLQIAEGILSDPKSNIDVSSTTSVSNSVNILKHKASILTQLGVSYLKTKDIKKAIERLNEAKEIAMSNNFKKIEMDCHFYLSEAYNQQGDVKKANTENKLFITLKNSISDQQLGASKEYLTKDISIQKKIIDEQNQSITNLYIQKKKLLAIGTLTCILLAGLLLLFIKKKKRIDQERKKIKEDYSILSGEHLGLKSKMQELAKKTQKEQENQTTKTQPQYKNSSLSNLDRNRYMNQVLDYMEKEKPYLDFEINQTDLAAKLNISSHHFSEVLSFCFEQNFYNFINIYRVNAAKKIMKDPKYDQYKILAIGYKAGFKSKTSFNRVFKTHVGLTPSGYKKKQISLT